MDGNLEIEGNLPAISLLIATIGFLFYDLGKKCDIIIADLKVGKHKNDK